MDIRKCSNFIDARSATMEPLNCHIKGHEKVQLEEQETVPDPDVVADVDIDVREIYFLIMHFLSAGPCQRTSEQFWSELLEHQLLPRRYHAWYSRSGALSGHENDNGDSFPLSYGKLVQRYPHIEKDHLVKLLKQLILNAGPAFDSMGGRSAPSAVDVPTLLGTGSFSILSSEQKEVKKQVKTLPAYLRWPHMQADQVRGLTLREVGGGFPKHHRAPSIHFACYTVAKPLTMVQKMQNIKKLRGHRDAVYCAIFDRLGRYVITGSDDRLVKIWSMETAFCLASCRGHEGDITDLAVTSNNALVASASNDYSIRVWRIPDGYPISVLRGHTGAVTAIAFSPRQNSVYQLLSSSDDGTCRIWDARVSHCSLRVYRPKPTESISSLGKSNGSSSNNAQSSSNGLQSHQILCCTYNADGTVFVTGSSDTFARVWSAVKFVNDSDQPNHEIDVLAGHENDVNYVQFCGCAVAPRSSMPDSRNSWFNNNNIVTCSRDGSAIIWVPKSRKSHGKAGRWTRAYHLKVPPPPVPPQPPRGGPRQRLLPTPRGVNMIVWSLDNRFVLAAIMDCRICVWNAGDGSLVHSLTGHSQSTYVLDVHPFNPRIAMSAGYDGKTIVWDIWEGTPIWTYEIGRFKLVDGKFSPDGTSIVLSDDAGQIYLVNTGQGDSQKDAKYDQFFLGDYRPLFQDSAGNVVDQETQLAPYRRNIEDPLCDSSMIPYAEPYQSTYQRHRLGALNIEWRPSSIKFMIGTDIGLGHEILPLPDLDRVIEPLPEFMDALYWEPENEIVHDDTDSEYNVTDEYSSGGEQGILYSSASSDPEGSEEDNRVEQCHKDGLRRSKRRNHKASDVKLASSGRRVKKRNMDEHDGSSSRTKRVKKHKNGRKTSKKIEAKALRSQRVAARNATSLFTQITEASADEDECSSEDDSSESEITLKDSNTRRMEHDCNLQNEHLKDPKDEQASLYDSRDVSKPFEPLECHKGIGKRTRLVLKLPSRDLSTTSENTRHQIDNEANLPSLTSSPAREISKEDCVNMMLEDPGLSSANGYGTNEVESCYGTDFRGREPNKLETSTADKESKIRWGEVKVQSSQKMTPYLSPTDASTGFCATLDGHKGNKNDVTINDKSQNDVTINEVDFSCPTPLIQDFEGKLLSGNCSVEKQFETGTSERMAGSRDRYRSTEDIQESSLSDIHEQYDMVTVINHSVDLEKNPAPKPIKIRIKSNKVFRDPERPFQLNESKRRTDDAGHSGVKLNWSRSNPEGYSVAPGVRVSKATSRDDSSGSDLPEDNVPDAFRRTRSMGLHTTSRETDAVNPRIESRQGLRSSGTSKQKSLKKTLEQLPSEEWTRSPKIVRGTKGVVYRDNVQKISAPTSQPYPRTSNWLTQSQQEEGCRYIPQISDHVVYLRQGHEGYLEKGGLSERRPWVSVKKNIRAVEFCSVEGLSYSQVPGSGESCCRITLKFTDPSSSAFGEAIKFTLPELTDDPDFLVERTRFDAAIRRNWSLRDKCLVWWRSGSDQEDGSWWKGRIVSSKDRSDEFPGSPWERFDIQYDDDPANIYPHSPWELYDPESSWEHPHMDDETEHTLLSAFAHLLQFAREKQDPYGILRLNQVAEKLDFINKFPVPLSPDLIELRLRNKYYRSIEAVKHDMRVMLSNAQTYFEKNAEVGAKMKRLLEWFAKTLSNL